MNLRWLKSAIVAAKKKNNLNEEIIFLVGDEDQVQTQQKTTGSTQTSRKASESAPPVPVRAKVEKTPSFKDTLSKINSIGKAGGKDLQEKQKSGGSDTSDKPKDAFTQADFDERWVIFVERLRKKDIRMYSALKSIEPVVLGEYNIEIVLQNNAQVEEFQLRLKPMLTSELREALHNDYIEVIERVADSENLERPTLLNDKEKLEKMIEKNPALLQLKNKFKLDFE